MFVAGSLCLGAGESGHFELKERTVCTMKDQVLRPVCQYTSLMYDPPTEIFPTFNKIPSRIKSMTVFLKRIKDLDILYMKNHHSHIKKTD